MSARIKLSPVRRRGLGGCVLSPRLWFACALVHLCAVPAVAAEAPAVEVADVNRIADLANPVTSPDGKWIAYSVSHQDLEANRIVTRVWLIGRDGNQRHEVAAPAGASAWQAEFTRDGTALLFLCDAGEERIAQVWRLALPSGQAQQLTHMPGGVADFSSAPDGTRLALTSDTSDEAGDADKGPIVIGRYHFKDDDRGYLAHKRRRLFIFGVAGQTLTPVSPRDVDVFLPAVSPDGSRVAYVTQADRQIGLDLTVADMNASEPARRVSNPGRINNDPEHLSRLAWSPDGRALAFLQAGPERLLEYAPWELAVVDLAGGSVRRVGMADHNYTHPAFSADGRLLYAIVEQERNSYLQRIDLASGKTLNLTSGKRLDVEFALLGEDHFALISGDDLHPYRLSLLGPEGESFPTGHNDWLANHHLATVRDLEWHSRDGTLIEGFLVLPLDYQPGHSYPTIVELHGGPVYQFSHEFMFDWQVYAARGYVVLGVNPRGSSGRGFAFAHAIWADWGHRDVEDVLAGVDYVTHEGFADAQHLGVGGWSYGAMLTDYTIASDARFKAAVSGAGSGNMLANYGSDEYSEALEAELGLPWTNTATYLRVSFPFFHNERIVTPTLFMCAALDFNVPCAGSEQMYQALRSRHVPTALVIYRDQHHTLDVPSDLADRLARNLSWYERYLKPQAADRPAAASASGVDTSSRSRGVAAHAQ